MNVFQAPARAEAVAGTRTTQLPAPGHGSGEEVR